MKRNHLLFAVAFFFLPIIGRALWYYSRVYIPKTESPIPGYAELTLPLPPVNPDLPEEEGKDTVGNLVLLDWAHDNQFDVAELQTLLVTLDKRGAKVEIIQDSFGEDHLSLDDGLKHASAYIVIAPRSVFTPFEIKVVNQFVDRGGRVLVISEPTRGVEFFGSFEVDSFGFQLDQVTAVNTLVTPFDLAFSDDYLYNLLENEGNFRNVLFNEFGEDDLTEDLTTLAFYTARSVITQTGLPLIISDDDTLSSRTDTGGGHAAAALSADGNVLAIGDMTFMTPPYDQVADNPLFLSHLVDFLLIGEVRRDLHVFPYIFERPIAILRTEEFDLSADTLDTFAELESGFASRGLALSIIEESISDTDLILFSSFEPNEDVQPFLEPFQDLVLPEDSEEGILTLPEFGDVNPTGLAVILLHQSEDRNTLILLAETVEDLLTLAETLAGDELYGCLVRGEIALCKVGLGEGFSFEEEFDFNGFDYDLQDVNTDNLDFTDPLIPTPTPFS